MGPAVLDERPTFTIPAFVPAAAAFEGSRLLDKARVMASPPSALVSHFADSR